MKIYWHDAGHMTKIAATPIYGKNPSKKHLPLWNRWTDLMHQILRVNFLSVIFLRVKFYASNLTR